MIVPTKLHPLWYSTYLPIHFFVSAVAAGLSMVIVEGMISHRVYHHQVEITREQFDSITLGLAKAASVVLAVYFAIKVMGVVMDGDWPLLATGWGAWFMVEMFGFVLLPCILYAVGYRERRPRLVRGTAVLTVLGIVLNRFNVSFIAYNYALPPERRYVPHWMEIWVTVALITLGVVAFKWIADRMPIMYTHPDYKGEH